MVSSVLQKYFYLMSGASDNGWENSPGGVIPSKSSFAHARAIVNNKSSGIFITHFEFCLRVKKVWKSEVGKRLMSNDYAPGHTILYMRWSIGKKPTNSKQTIPKKVICLKFRNSRKHWKQKSRCQVNIVMFSCPNKVARVLDF